MNGSGILIFFLVLLLACVTTGLAVMVIHNKKYGCVQGVCKESPHGDFTSMAACQNNCKPPVVMSNCRGNSKLPTPLKKVSNDLCPMIPDDKCPTSVKVFGQTYHPCNLHHHV